jgi:hypothetical protein
MICKWCAKEMNYITTGEYPITDCNNHLYRVIHYYYGEWTISINGNKIIHINDTENSIRLNFGGSKIFVGPGYLNKPIEDIVSEFKILYLFS